MKLMQHQYEDTLRENLRLLDEIEQLRTVLGDIIGAECMVQTVERSFNEKRAPIIQRATSLLATEPPR